MTQSENPHKTQILNFFYDEDDSCAFTFLVNDVRFHVIVDPSDLQKSSEKPLYYEYLDKISALREAEEREERTPEEAEAKAPNDRTTHGRGSNDKDSAIDMTADEDEEDEDQDSGSAGVELRNWILLAFAKVIEESAPLDSEPEESTLYDWYHGPTYFYSLHIKGGELTPELLEPTDELNDRIEKLVPRMKMPKYIQNIDVPGISSQELIVQSEVSIPEPAHPGKVTHRESGEVYFFKPVDDSQPGPTKREIQILQKLEKLDLDIMVPRLRGFVVSKQSKSEIMGLLLSHIDNPQPLTKLLKSSVSKAKREMWSKKSADYVKRLHEHQIIWGDAKADNFLVDGHDELWIIDFGGSYTEGWVDPKLNETKEGDKQGLEKIQKALEDPDRNTFDPAPTEGASERETSSSLFVTERKDEEHLGKRKRGNEDKEENKRRREVV